MSRLIDADALVEKAYWHGEHPSVDNPFAEGADAVDVSDIEESPTIEAEPLRHGRWVIEKRHEVSCNPYIDDNYFASATCSECDFCIHAETKSFGYPDLNTTNYCPNCGAKMDLGGMTNDEG